MNQKPLKPSRINQLQALVESRNFLAFSVERTLVLHLREQEKFSEAFLLFQQTFLLLTHAKFSIEA